jgi:hypothetical protein
MSKTLRADLTAFIKKYNLPSTHIYTQKEWKARGEKWGDNTPFVLTTEDALYESLNYLEWPALADELRAIAEKHGRYIEQGYSWTVNFPER